MRNSLLLIFLLQFSLLAGARPWPQDGSDLPVDPAVQWGQLDNGIRYVILPWSEPPERISLRLLVEAGAIHETDRQKGLAHTIEHMAFNGTRNFSAGDMVEYFQRLGMGFGPDTNAHTWWRETVYKLDLPRNNEELLRDGLKLLRDYADGILFEEEQLEKEKGVVLSEFRDGNSPEFLAYIDGLKFALPDALPSRRMTIGDEDVIHMATRQDLVDYYEKWYTPDRMVLIAVGEVDPDNLRALFAEYFSSMEPVAERTPDPEMGFIAPAQTKTRLFSNAELPMGELEIYTRRQIEPVTDSVEQQLEQIKLDLANTMLARRFDKLSQEEGAVFTHGQGYDYRWLDFVRYSGVYLQFEPVDWKAAMEVAVTELNRAVAYGFTESELREAQANMINGLEEAAARVATRKSRDLSDLLVRSVRDGEVFMDPVAQRDLFVQAVETISLNEVNALFKEAWSQEERLINLTGNFENLVKAQFEAAAAIDVEPPAVEEAKEWAYADFGEVGKLNRLRYIQDLEIHQFVLANGVRLNLKKTDYEANKISVKASFGCGKLEAPEDLPGLPLMASAIFIPGGLGQHSYDEIQALTAGKTLSLDFSVNDNEFTLGGNTNADDLLLQLQLLVAYLKDPGFRPEGRRLFMRQLDGLYTQLAHDPNAVVQNEVSRFLAGGDPRFGFPEREDVEARTTAEVAAWLDEALKSSYLELSIVGDYAEWKPVLDAVLATFGTLPVRAEERPAHEESRQINFPRGAGKQVIEYVSEIPRAMATVGWPTTDQSDIGEVRRLGVLASVYTDRMRIQIRKEIGEAYSPYAFNRSSDTYTDYGVFLALVGVVPEKADLIEGILVDIGSRLAADGIDSDELVRAIEPMKSQIVEYRRTNGYWLNSVLLRSQTEPQRLDWARSFEGFWETVTVEQINDLAKRYLQPEEGIPVQVQPRS